MDRRRSKASRMKSFRDLEQEVDKRAERAHRRSIDQRQMRQLAMTKRRNISGEDTSLSPIKETKKEPPKKGSDMKDKLKEWQKARNQRKAEEAKKQAQKPQFKVYHADRSTLAYDKPVASLAPVKGAKKAPGKAEKDTKAIATASGPAARRQTRSQTSKTTNSVAPKRALATKTTGAATKATSTSTKAGPSRTTRTTTGNRKETEKQPAGRITRATTASVQGRKPTTDQKDVKTRGKTATATQPEKKRKVELPVVKKPEPATKAASTGKTGRHVTRSRGCEDPNAASTSFAPTDFTFNAETFKFNPLSPASAASFLFPGEPPEHHGPSRCSTPSIAGSSGPVMNSPALSGIAEGKRPTPLSNKPKMNLAKEVNTEEPSQILKPYLRTRQTKATDTESEPEKPASKTPRRRSTRSTTDVSGSEKAGRRTPRRRSVQQGHNTDTCDTDSEVDKATHKTPARQTPRRRSTRHTKTPGTTENDMSPAEKSTGKGVKRRSVCRNAETGTDSESEKPARKTPRRRSVRGVVETTESESEVEKPVTKTPRSTRRSRGSVSMPNQEAASENNENQSEDKDTETTQETKTPSNRRRSRRSISKVSDTEEEPAVKATPRGRRRSTRRSSTLPELTESSAESETADGDTERGQLFTIAEVHQDKEAGSGEPQQGAVQDATVSTTSVPSQAADVASAPAEETPKEAELACEAPVSTKDEAPPVLPPSASPSKDQPSSAVTTVNEEQADTVAVEQQVTGQAKMEDSKLPVLQDEPRNSSTPQHAEAAREPMFLTPSSTARMSTRSSRRRTVHNASGILAACKGRKTPKHRNSLMLKAMSPEEKFEFMMNSPMVEMRRRRKSGGLDDSMVEPLPDFETLEAEVASQSEGSTLSTAESDAVATATESENSASEAPIPVETEPVVSTTEPSRQTDLANSEPEGGAREPEEAAKEVEGVAKDQEGGAGQPEGGAKDPEGGAKEAEHDVPYFRSLLATERQRLNQLCERWDQTKDTTPELSEDVQGQIRTTIGKAHLLMNQRFRQFEGLVDDCEFQRGEKATHCSDLQGFWDMIYYQVEDVDAKFAELSRLEVAGWQVAKEQPKKKVVKKKAAKPAGTNKAAAGAKSKFAEFRAKMLAQKKKESQEEPQAVCDGKPAEGSTQPQEAEGQGAEVSSQAPQGQGLESSVVAKASVEKQTQPEICVPPQEDPEENKENIDPVLKTFEGGFFSVTSPVKLPEPHCEGGSPNRFPSRPGSRQGSHTNTPTASPMLKAVLHRSARKSLGLGQMVASPAGRRSLQLGEQSSSRAALVTLKLSPMAKRTPDSAKRSLRDDQPDVTGASTGSSAEGDSVSSSATPRLTTRRSLRISDDPHSNEEEVAMETNTDGADDFSRFLQPTVVNTPKEMMELDLSLQTANSPEDVEMAAPTKRGLAAEFKEETKEEKVPDSQSKSGRRSVHFADLSPPLEAQMSRLPATPFNRDSLVPRTRRATGDKNQKASSHPVDSLLMMTPDGPGVHSSFSDEDLEESPSTQFSRLRVNYTPAHAAGKSRTVDDMLFSPVQPPTSPLKERNTTPNAVNHTSPVKNSVKSDEMSPTFDLISFTPAHLDKPSANSQSVAPSAGRKSALKSANKRRSTRRSNLNVSFL